MHSLIRSVPTRRRSVAATFLVLAAAAMYASDTRAAVYWASYGAGGIGIADLSGAAARQLTSAHNPCGVAVDHDYVYWGVGPAFSIGRARLDGTRSEPDFITGLEYPCGVAVTSTHIYWAEGGGAGRGSSIGRANLDGTGVTRSFISGLNTPCAVAVNSTHLFWADCGPGGPRSSGTTIGRADIDGSNANDAYITGASSPAGIAVSGTHIFWSNSNTGTIGRADLSGGNINQSYILASPSPGQGAPSVTGVAVGGGHIFWDVFRDLAPATIGRADLDGTSIQQSFITAAGPGWIRGVAVDARERSATSVTLSPPSGPFGTDQSVTATVTNVGADATPSGTVQFLVNGELFGAPVSLDNHGQATVVPDFWFDVGDTVTARYAGDDRFLASASASTTTGIGPAETETDLTTTPNPVASGGQVDVLVRVENVSTNAPVFGAIQFAIDGAPLGDPLTVDDGGTLAITLVADVPPGAYTATANFSEPEFGDFLPSGDSALQRVDAPSSPPSPRPPSSPGPAPSLPAPQVQRQDLTRMTAQLRAALRRRGLSALKQAVQTFAPQVSGTLTQTVSARPNPGAARQVIARGAVVFATPGAAKLRLRLTTAGRRTLLTAKRLALTIHTRFKPVGTAGVRSTVRVTVRKRGSRTMQSDANGIAHRRLVRTALPTQDAR